MKKIRFSLALKVAFVFISLITFTGCKNNKDNKDTPIIKKTYEPNTESRIKKYAEENPLFGISRNKKEESVSILWKASLETLEFMPLATVDYAGGVIVTDWYSKEGNKDEIKISVRFMSQDLKSDSIKVIGYKRVCKENKCSVLNADNLFAEKISEAIFNKARKLSIQKEKNN
jgi:hypothetical protein